MSYLEKEDDKQSSFWDWVVGIGLVVLIGGFTFYYNFQKRSSISGFAEADSLYQAGRYREAGRQYEELKRAQYLTNKDDSIISVRMDSIDAAEEQGAALVAAARSRLESGDTAAARAELGRLRFPELLGAADSAWADSLIRDPLSSSAP